MDNLLDTFYDSIVHRFEPDMTRWGIEILDGDLNKDLDGWIISHGEPCGYEYYYASKRDLMLKAGFVEHNGDTYSLTPNGRELLKQLIDKK